MSELPEELAGRTPEEVLAFLREASDDELRRQVQAIGTARVLGLVFAGWAQRVPPGSRSPGLLVFALADDAGDGVVEHRHGLRLSPEGAQAADTPEDPARATVRTSVLRFLRVAAGAADPKRLVLTGRMRLGGDVVWAVVTLAGLRP